MLVPPEVLDGSFREPSGVPSVSTFCYSCGSKIRQVKFCPRCGIPRAPDSTPSTDAEMRIDWSHREPPYLLPDCSGMCHGRALMPDWKFCPGCGQEVPPIEPDLRVRCPRCRYPYAIESGELFCPHDGTPLPPPQIGVAPASPTTGKRAAWWSRKS
jgi:predicted amidophosphoribosyltransferase